MFCVRCGLEVGDAPLVGGLCEACYLAEHPLASLPVHVDLERCVHCGARKRGEQWIELGEPVEATVAASVREAVQLDRRVASVDVDVRMRAEDEHAKVWAATAVVRGTSEGISFTRELTTRARVKGGTCLRCSRIAGGYYEATVQVRATRRDMTKEEMRRTRALCSRLIEQMVGEGDRNAFVLRDEEVHGGLDVVVGTTNAARIMAKAIERDFGAKVTESARLAGKKDGVDLYRITFALRLPEYGVGDVVVVADGPRLVQSIQAKRVTLHDPVTGRVATADRDAVDKAPVLARRDAREAVVVSALDGELQLLDPWTFATVNVKRPAAVEGKPETVPVVRWEEELFVLPPARE